MNTSADFQHSPFTRWSLFQKTLFFLVAYVFLAVTTMGKVTAQEIIIEGTLTITCPEGFIAGQSDASSNYDHCYKEVRFHQEDNLSLIEARILCKGNGWIMATESQVTEAWKWLGLDVFAYGMINDGRLAVPVQSDRAANIPKGPNIGITGGNQGFFYTQVTKPGEAYSIPNGTPIVKFHGQSNISLDAAKALCETKGWIMASADDVALAWEKLGLDQTAYGLLRDGMTSLPLQYDRSAEQRKGANIMKRSSNEGFFYFDEVFTTQQLVQEVHDFNPQNTTVTSSGIPIVVDPNFAHESTFNLDFWPVCPNPLTDLFESSPHISPYHWFFWKAAAKFEAVEGESLAGEEYRSLIWMERLQDDRVLRWRFMPFLIETFWDALTVPFPNSDQLTFRNQFNSWISCDKNKMDEMLLESWLVHTGQPNRLGIGSITQAPYKPNTLTTLISGTRSGIDGFLPHRDPLRMGADGLEALKMLLKPVFLQETDAPSDVEYIRPLAGNMLQVISDAVGDDPAHVILTIRMLGEFGEISGSVASTHELDPYAQAAIDELIAQLQKQLEGMVDEVAQLVVEQLIVGGGKLASSVLGGISLIASVLTNDQVIGHIKTATYEDALKRDAANKAPIDIKQFLGNGSDVSRNGWAFNMLLKMCVAELDGAADLFELPPVECPPGAINTSGRLCLYNVYFFAAPNLSLVEAQTIADRNGWQLATPMELIAAQSQFGFEHFGYGRLFDGRFAVPLQKGSKYASFSDGANIVTTGGNDGFFYTKDKPNEYNVAKGKSVRQSSTYGSSVASLAVDGNTDGNWNNGSVSHTDPYGSHYLVIDLGAIHEISAVRVFPRTDCCRNESKSIRISYSTEPFMFDRDGLVPPKTFDKGFGNIGELGEFAPDQEVYTFFGKRACQYLIISKIPTDGSYLSLAEVEVFGRPLPGDIKLLSKGKPARQSSIYENKDANRAVDGNTDGNFWGQSVTHTNYEQSPWLEVDLGAEYDITKIRIFPRTDCCPWRLDGFNIKVSNQPFTSNADGSSFVSDHPFKTIIPVTVEGNASGRYVRIYLTGANYLSMSEIEIFGKEK